MAKATWDKEQHELAKANSEALVAVAVNGKYSGGGGYTIGWVTSAAKAKIVWMFAHYFYLGWSPLDALKIAMGEKESGRPAKEWEPATAPAIKHSYGYCPTCGAPGVSRERRLNGDDKCERGHTYPSAKARKTPKRGK